MTSCPGGGGTLRETEVRRRETKASFATQKECQQAMNKLLVAVETHNYTALTKVNVQTVPHQGVAAGREGTIRPSKYKSYVQHVECYIAPHIGSVKLAKLTGSQVNVLYAKLVESDSKDSKRGLFAMTIHHVHSCLHKACKDAVRWGHISRNPLDAADPPRKKGDGTREMRTWTKEHLRAFLESVHDDRLSSLWHTIAMTGMRRGEATGLR